MFAYHHVLWHSPTLVSVRALGWPDGSGSPRCAPEVGLNLRRRFSALSCTVVDNSLVAGVASTTARVDWRPDMVRLATGVSRGGRASARAVNGGRGATR